MGKTKDAKAKHFLKESGTDELAILHLRKFILMH